MRITSLLQLGTFAAFLAAAGSLHAQAGHPGISGVPSSSSSPGINFGGLSIDSSKPKVVNRRLIGSVHVDGKSAQGAVVYLKNLKTNEIESIIADEDGKYRFGDLAKDTDYQLWAQEGKKKSAAKSISQFDTRDELSVNLNVE